MTRPTLGQTPAMSFSAEYARPHLSVVPSTDDDALRYYPVTSADGTHLEAWTNDVDGPTVLLCNGLGTNPYAWPELLRPDCGVRVISWNHRGVGGSERPADPSRVGMDAFVEDAVAVLDDAGVDSCVAAGWSIGVEHRLRARQLHPERVSGLFAVAGVPGGTFASMGAPLLIPRPLRRPIALGVTGVLARAGRAVTPVTSRLPMGTLSAQLLTHSGFMFPVPELSHVQRAVREFLQTPVDWYMHLARESARHPRVSLRSVTVPDHLRRGAPRHPGVLGRHAHCGGADPRRGLRGAARVALPPARAPGDGPRGAARTRPTDRRKQRGLSVVAPGMKKIGFLSFGHWTPSPHSQTRRRPTRCCSPSTSRSPPRSSAPTARTSGCTTSPASWPRRSRCSPRSARRTSRIEIGTGVIDMRYENPLYMAEDAGAADLISGGRLQLGISRGSPEQVIDGFRYFGHVPGRGLRPRRDGARAHPGLPRRDRRRGLRRAQPAADVPQPARPAADRAALPRAARPDLVGCRHPRDRRVDRRAGHEPDELDPAHRGHRRAVPPAPGRADPAVPRRLEGGRARARAPRLGQPQHLPDRQRPGPRLLRPGARRARTRSATSTAASPASARPTPASRTSWSRSSPRTRRSPPPTRCC